jgi:hypothetical protein
MDGETIDFLAKPLGLEEQVAAIPKERWMVSWIFSNH